MPFDWTTKGLPPSAEGLTSPELKPLGFSLLRGELMMPAAVLKESALSRNIEAMQAFAERNGAHLCPHGKTSMSPELFRMQIEAGAWGLTAATAHHVRVYRRLGIGRIFLANVLVGPADLDFVMAELKRDPDFDFYSLVDSIAAVDIIGAAARKAGLDRPVQLLVETGMEGGRAGVRTVTEALAVARRIRAAEPGLVLRGVETFEGIRQSLPDARFEAVEMIDLALIAAHDIAREDLFGAGPILVSAGGSAFLDLCAARLPERIEGRDVVRVIRPGCYVTHDHGIYHRLTQFDGVRRPGLAALEPALEVWAHVLSVPEPGRAIVGLGKRDVSTDVDPPLPILVQRAGADAAPEAAVGMKVIALWDQHLALDMADGELAVGDLVGFGISHPCSTFDRWRALLTVDDDYRVTGAVTTLF